MNFFTHFEITEEDIRRLQSQRETDHKAKIDLLKRLTLRELYYSDRNTTKIGSFLPVDLISDPLFVQTMVLENDNPLELKVKAHMLETVILDK